MPEPTRLASWTLVASLSVSACAVAQQTDARNAVAGSGSGGSGGSGIPRTWDEARLDAQHVPLADARVHVTQVSAQTYYAMPERSLYRSYPIYHPDREPPGYLAELEQKEPEVLSFGTTRSRTEREWLEYGREVFQLPTGSDADAFGTIVSREQVRDPRWYEQVSWDRDTGIMPYARWWIREKGKVEVGTLSCAMCHTRVMPEGGMVTGAQGNFPFDRNGAEIMRAALPAFPDEQQALAAYRSFDVLLYGIPWRMADPFERLAPVTLEKYIAIYAAIPPGVLARFGTSPLQPVQVPDLIGVRHRRYLDRTGLVRHEEIGDLMRYAALNQAAEVLTRYGDFVPAGPDLSQISPALLTRFSDEQLYALAKYIYALTPPANPNLPRTTEQRGHVARGKKVFERLNCGLCHRPPLYTNNRLTPVAGFEVPSAHLTTYAVTELALGTDPGLTLETRRGTGYYKVPSLLGVWYRGPFEHNGSIATLEDWFDPRRLADDYVPTGWKGPPGTTHRAVRGHVYGLNLPAADREALIAFLRTL